MNHARAARGLADAPDSLNAVMRTRRLDLFPGTVPLLDADLDSREALARQLSATVPASWPPGEYDCSAMEFFRARLLERPGEVGWYGWYAVHAPTDREGAVLIGAGGYFGPPGPGGVIEIGYSIIPEARAMGFAMELVSALVARAFAVLDVTRIIAHTTEANRASVRVLEKCDFTFDGAGDAAGTVRFVRSRRRADVRHRESLE